MYKHKYTKLFYEIKENGDIEQPERGMVIGYDKDVLILSFYDKESKKKTPEELLENEASKE